MKIRKFFSIIIVSFLLVFLVFVIAHQTKAENTEVNQMWQIHQQDQPIASPLIAQKPPHPVYGKLVSYGSINNQELRGYLVHPTDKQKELPALIVIHEWWGLNDNIKKMTERLAGEGYTALAVDVYNGQVADNPEKAKELVTEALKNTSLLEENLRQSYKYLETTEKAPKIGTIGWCFGGTWSLNTALLLPKEIDATVIYYGGGIETSPERLKNLQMPILGIFGELDQNPSVTKVREFEKTLKSLGKSVNIYIYPNADHAFANPSGTRYNEVAARDAWQKTISFLHQNLQ